MSVTYRFFPDVDLEHSRAIIREAATLLPSGAEILAQKGWNGFLEYHLGEEQFGPERYNLSASKRLYYHSIILSLSCPAQPLDWFAKATGSSRKMDFH